MRKLIIATTALAFLSSTAFPPSAAFAQGTTAPAASDTKGDTMSKDKMGKKKSKKSGKMSKTKSDDTKQ